MASTAVSNMLSQCQTIGSALALSSGQASFKGQAVVSANPGKVATRSARIQIVAMAAKDKKVNAYDEAWSKKFFGYGYFAESSEDSPVDIVKTLEKKKLLTGIEKAGLLSKLEDLGLSLSKIEELGLLSKAESLGLLGFAEKFAASSPAAIASLSLPLLVLGLALPILIPDDNAVLLVGQYVLAALAASTGGALFIGSIVLGALQED